MKQIERVTAVTYILMRDKKRRFYREVEGNFKPNNKLVSIVPNNLQLGLSQLGRMCPKEAKEEPCTFLGKVTVDKSVPCMLNKVLKWLV